MRTIALITARGGSKSIPRKNIVPVGGKPLIVWTIEAALRSSRVSRVILSTDDEEIAAIARAAGCEVPFMRPAELAGDASSTVDVCVHALQWLEQNKNERPDYLLLLQPTSPLRSTADIDAAIQMAIDAHAEAVVGATQSGSHPFLSFLLEPDGTMNPFVATPGRRQDFPPAVVINGAIYVASRACVLEKRTFQPPGALPYLMPRERSIDIDDPWDLHLVQLLMEREQGLGKSEPVLRVREREIGAGRTTFVIAEAGVNHNGDLALAHGLIDAAVAAGADAVKFQTFTAESLVIESAPKADYQERALGGEDSQFTMLKKLELSREAHRELAAYARQRGIMFLSTPFDEGSVQLLAELGVDAFKISSGDVTDLPLLAQIARHKIPVILSTGMATLDEVAAAVETIREAGNPPLSLLHCVSCYPANPQSVNLRAMATMAERFGVPVGFSDHTLGTEIAIAAVAAGACVIEKHLTLDCSLPGPDHQASLDPETFATMVRGIRLIDAALGDGRKEPRLEEANTARVARKSVVTTQAIAAGEALTDSALAIKRPGHGFAPAMRRALVGRITRTAIPAGTVVTPEMLA